MPMYSACATSSDAFAVKLHALRAVHGWIALFCLFIGHDKAHIEDIEGRRNENVADVT